MSDNISFDEQHTTFTSSSAPKGLVAFLMNKCGVESESAANIILIVIAIIIFAISGIIFFNAFA